MARQTSKEAFDHIRSNGLLNRMELDIYGWLFQHGPATNRQIFKDATLARDLGVISSRTAAMVRKGVLYEVDTVTCSETGRRVLRFDVTDKLPMKPEQKPRVECPYCEGNGWVHPPKGNKV